MAKAPRNCMGLVGMDNSAVSDVNRRLGRLESSHQALMVQVGSLLQENFDQRLCRLDHRIREAEFVLETNAPKLESLARQLALASSPGRQSETQLSNEVTQLKSQLQETSALESSFMTQLKEQVLPLEAKLSDLDACVESRIQESVVAQFDKVLDYTRMLTIILPSHPNGLGIETSVDYNRSGIASLCIEKVIPGGAVADWNQAKKSSEALQPGDKIVGINHVYGSAAELREQLTSPFVADIVLSVSRAGVTQLLNKVFEQMAIADEDEQQNGHAKSNTVSF